MVVHSVLLQTRWTDPAAGDEEESSTAEINQVSHT
jgi:hypothetical protein